MACYFSYFVDSVECSNDNAILKNHAEKEIQIVFTECGILPDNVNESSLNICSTHFSHILERSCISTHPEARSTRKKDRLLTFQNVISIRENFGIILPVETRKCIRKSVPEMDGRPVAKCD
jgi:hypothetical protein